MTHTDENERNDIRNISVSFKYMTRGFVTWVYRTVIYLFIYLFIYFSLIYINEVFSVIRPYEFS